MTCSIICTRHLRLSYSHLRALPCLLLEALDLNHHYTGVKVVLELLVEDIFHKGVSVASSDL